MEAMSEVQYMTVDGPVHTDLPTDDRELLHDALDEWLNKSQGTGFFYVGSFSELRDNFQD
jgi:hypothetical protein